MTTLCFLCSQCCHLPSVLTTENDRNFLFKLDKAIVRLSFFILIFASCLWCLINDDVSLFLLHSTYAVIHFLFLDQINNIFFSYTLKFFPFSTAFCYFPQSVYVLNKTKTHFFFPSNLLLVSNFTPFTQYDDLSKEQSVLY